MVRAAHPTFVSEVLGGLEREERYAEGEKVTWLGAAVNILLAIAKLIAGIFGRSEALIADAVHSLSDLLTDAVVLISIKVAKKPVDDCHPYGHGRVETVGTALVGLLLIAVSIGILWKAFDTMSRGVDYTPTWIALFAATVSIIVKELMYRYTVGVGRKTGSSSIIANAWHHRSDAFSSAASLAGVGAAMMGWPVFDPIAAAFVTILIFKVGWDTVQGAFVDIIDTAVKKEIRNEIVDISLKIPGVKNYHELKTRKIGSEILVDIHIEVNPWMNVAEAHAIADNVRDAIMDNIEHVAGVLVHIDPEGELDGIVYSTPKDEMQRLVVNKASAVKGVKECRDVMLHYVGNHIVVNLTIVLASNLSIKQGHAKVKEVKKMIIAIDNISEAVISVDIETGKG